MEVNNSGIGRGSRSSMYSSHTSHRSLQPPCSSYRLRRVLPFLVVCWSLETSRFFCGAAFTGGPAAATDLGTLMEVGSEAGSWDPYAELGVDTCASVEEIKTAFRERARQCHPDKVSRRGQQNGGLTLLLLVVSGARYHRFLCDTSVV